MLHATRNIAACQLALKMKEMRLPIRMIAEKQDEGSHQAIIVMEADTKALFYVNEMGDSIRDDYNCECECQCCTEQ